MVRSFEYRQPRLHTDFDLDFCVDGKVLRGQCTDVSPGGISATFGGKPLEVGNSGSVTLHYPLRQFKLDAVVAHLEGEHVGLTFLCRNPEERMVSEQFASLVHASAVQ